MVTDLIVPKRRIVAPKPPSYIKLDMAFALGEGTKLLDKSRYRSHGTISGADWATGLHGKCLDFVSTVPDYVVIPAAHTQLNFTTEDFSLVMRLYADTLVDNAELFLRGRHNADGYRFLVNAVGQLSIFTYQLAANQQSFTGLAAMAAGAWYTIGFSRAGASGRLYSNGVDVTVVPAVHIDPLTCARTAKIGIYDDLATRPFDGRIEFLRIFGGIALSASEHLAYHNALA